MWRHFRLENCICQESAIGGPRPSRFVNKQLKQNNTLKIYFTELRRKLKVLRIKLKEKSLSV